MPTTPETPDGLLARLQALGIETRTVRHPPVFTVAESRDLRGALPGGHSKNVKITLDLTLPRRYPLSAIHEMT